MRCDECRFCNVFRPNEDEPNMSIGGCHRFPPRAAPDWETQMTDGRCSEEDVGAWAFPVVYGNDWCGEFQSRTEAKPDLRTRADFP